MKTGYRSMAAVALALVAFVLVACGDEGETVEGEFALVADAPSGFEDASGTATLTRKDDSTEVTLEVSGLEPDSDYTSHVHLGGCGQPDPGGPHFKFDPDGGDTPPNEIHLPFTTDSDGIGSAEATADQVVPEGEAGAIVIHTAPAADGDDAMDGDEHSGDSEKEAASDGHTGHAHSDKIICADLD